MALHHLKEASKRAKELKVAGVVLSVTEAIMCKRVFVLVPGVSYFTASILTVPSSIDLVVFRSS